MKSKTIIFVLVPIQKVIFYKKRWLFCVYCMTQFEGLSTLKMLTTDSLGNVRAIEKVAMFESRVVLYGFFWQARPSMGFKQRRPRRQRKRQKSNTFRLAKQELCTCITLFWYISLPSLHDYDVKVPNFTFCWGREHRPTIFFFVSSTSMQSFRIHLQKKVANICRIERDEINANSLFRWRFCSRRRRCCLSSLFTVQIQRQPSSGESEICLCMGWVLRWEDN